MILQEKKQQINLNFELALNNSVIMLFTKHYVDQPKTKSANNLDIHTLNINLQVLLQLELGQCKIIQSFKKLLLADFPLQCSVIMLPTKNYVDRPKTKSAIALTKIILKICTFSIKKHDFTRKKQ
jgi:hypothetical protein